MIKYVTLKTPSSPVQIPEHLKRQIFIFKPAETPVHYCNFRKPSDVKLCSCIIQCSEARTQEQEEEHVWLEVTRAARSRAARPDLDADPLLPKTKAAWRKSTSSSHQTYVAAAPALHGDACVCSTPSSCVKEAPVSLQPWDGVWQSCPNIFTFGFLLERLHVSENVGISTTVHNFLRGWFHRRAVWIHFLNYLTSLKCLIVWLFVYEITF